MARIRTIKPEIASDAKLARLSRGTRYHFVLLWTVADDAGFFRATPRQLLGQLYPHDRDIGEADVDRMTAELVEAGFLNLHQTDDGPIGCVANWSKHQKIDRPSRSHLRESCASDTRVPRELSSEGVLSPDLGVLTNSTSSAREDLLSVVPNRAAWEGELRMCQDGGRGAPFKATDEQIDTACRDYLGNGAAQSPNLAQFRAYIRRAVAGEAQPPPRRGGTGQRSYDNTLKALQDLPEAG